MYLQEYFIPYLISNLIAILILLVAWKAPRWARWSIVLIFIWASAVNAYTANTTPEVYLEYAPMAIPIYRSFINGWFAAHVQMMVTLIAIGQLTIALLLSLKGFWFNLGILGASIFLLAIAPLGVGSGFPFSLIMVAALFLLYKYYNRKTNIITTESLPI